MISLRAIIIGAVVGLLVTVGVTMLWPRKRLAILRGFVAPVIGVGVAYLLMRVL
ncbi:MAG TPA: hypothetical protein VGK74_17680 [Symbiobacteriaceae bacterium]|jgi:phosphate/sulfate permease